MQPIVGLVGYSGSGKTSLLEKLIPRLKNHLQKIAVIKASHHAIELDQPGKDSYRYRQSGADCVVLATPNATFSWQRRDPDADALTSIVSSLQAQNIDLILFEGFKHAAFPKIVIYRSVMGEFDASLVDRHCIAIACDAAANLNYTGENTTISRLNIDDPQQIAEFIYRRIAHA